MSCFYKQHFYKQHQTEIWSTIITISSIKIGQKKNKEHYCYQIYTLLMKSPVLTPHSIDFPPTWTTPQFLQKKTWCALFLWFFSNLKLTINKEGLHYVGKVRYMLEFGEWCWPPKLKRVLIPIFFECIQELQDIISR